jgi:hypothetical protein
MTLSLNDFRLVQPPGFGCVYGHESVRARGNEDITWLFSV